MSIALVLKEISKNWLEYRDHCKSISKSGASIRIVKQDHKIYDLVINQWTNLVSKNVNLKKYIVESSLGLGNLSAAPWLTIMDKT